MRKNINILLVEDNDDHAELVKDAIADVNPQCTVVHVQDGELAVQHLDAAVAGEHPVPSLILLDIKMPRFNGYETLGYLKGDAALKLIPVVMLSTSSTECDVNRCFNMGANGYVSKPLDYVEFNEKIKHLNQYWTCASELPNPSPKVDVANEYTFDRR